MDLFQIIRDWVKGVKGGYMYPSILSLFLNIMCSLSSYIVFIVRLGRASPASWRSPAALAGMVH